MVIFLVFQFGGVQSGSMLVVDSIDQSNSRSGDQKVFEVHSLILSLVQLLLVCCSLTF